MQLAFTSFENLGDSVWYIGMALVGIWIAIATPHALRFIDKAYAEKARNNPVAAAKQVKAFRFIGFILALVGVSLVTMKLLGYEK